MSREIFTSKAEFYTVGGRWKLDIVALQTGGSCKMLIGFSIVTDFDVSPGLMSVMAVGYS